MRQWYFGILFFCLAVVSTNAISGDYAIVKKIKGQVLSNGVQLRVGDKVKVGKVIDASKKGSFIDLEIPGGGDMRLVGGVVKLNKLEKESSIFQLIKGKLFTYFKNLDKKGKKKALRILTNEGSFAVRGTKFGVIKDNEHESFICVCEGEVLVKNNYGAMGLVKANEEVRFSGTDMRIKNKINSRDMIKLRGIFKDMGH
ncbi:MAG: hypothetical protein CME61_02075 [Halobacteriovoraceae bacterium]|nr:hypothetical protein [Halobacteriovoraceae bacterium]|tara:strand:+ start:1130 stop:1726 length:597 start_codon:yes stop_codon:yes gene_type:complete